MQKRKPGEKTWVKKQQAAVDSMFRDYKQKGLIDDMLLFAMGPRPSLTMKRQIVTAGLGLKPGQMIKPIHVVGAGEFVGGSSRKRLKISISPSHSKKPVWVPEEWKSRVKGNYSSVQHVKLGDSWFRVWVDFSLVGDAIKEDSLSFGLMGSKGRTAYSWKGKLNEDARKQLLKRLSKQMEKTRQKTRA
jgi:hypothetical protein